MPRRHRSVWRRSPQSRLARIAVPVAIPVTLAVVVGGIVAVTESSSTSVNNTALSNCASPAAYVVPATTGTGTQAPATTGTGGTVPATAGTATVTPASTATATATPAGTATAAATSASTATATATATATPCPSGTAATTAVNPEAGAADLALTNPVDPAGNAINLNQTAAQAANTMNCTITAPANPLSAQGLATPWQLGDGCSEANPNQQAYVEATILAPNGQIQVYNPLVITQGTTPAATPVAPTIAAGSQVIINLGFNGNNLVLEGQGAVQGKCIDAFGNSIIAQTSACNAAAFFQDANAQIANATLKVAPLGTASDGRPCESTEDFALIDQDPSDNTDSEYLLNGNGQTAQDSLANKNAMGGSTVIANGSDNGLLGFFVDPALGCTPFSATDITSPNGTQSSQALDDLSSKVNDVNLAQQGIEALLPVNDPQLLVGGQFSIGKTNTYRMLQDEPLLPTAGAGTTTTTAANASQNQNGVLTSRIAALNSRIAALQNRNQTFQQQIAIIQGRGGAASVQNSQIAAVNSQIAAVNGQITTIQSQVATLQNQMMGGNAQNTGAAQNTMAANSLTTFKNQNAAMFCQNMVNIQPEKNQLDMAKFANFTSPVPAVGTNLATFMGARLSMSFTNLKCATFGLTNPVTLTLDGNGVATAVTYNLTQQKATLPTATTTTTGTCATTATATPTASATATAAAPTATATATNGFGNGRNGRNGNRFGRGFGNGRNGFGFGNGNNSGFGSGNNGGFGFGNNNGNGNNNAGANASSGSSGTQCVVKGGYDQKVPMGRTGHKENAAGM